MVDRCDRPAVEFTIHQVEAEAVRRAAGAQGDRETRRRSSQIGRIAHQALKEMRLLEVGPGRPREGAFRLGRKKPSEHRGTVYVEPSILQSNLNL